MPCRNLSTFIVPPIEEATTSALARILVRESPNVWLCSGARGRTRRREGGGGSELRHCVCGQIIDQLTDNVTPRAAKEEEKEEEPRGEN